MLQVVQTGRGWRRRRRHNQDRRCMLDVAAVLAWLLGWFRYDVEASYGLVEPGATRV